MPHFHTPVDAPEKWTIFKAYNKRDVEAEMEIDRRLSRFPVPDSIWEEFYLDQEINDRGIRIDYELVDAALTLDAQAKAKLTADMRRLTGIDNPNSVYQLLAWLEEQGCPSDCLDKARVKELLKTAKDPVKDQTDFLAQIDYLQVSKLMFPIGGLMKQEVREIANRAGLPSAKRKDSQGICFLGKINYNDFVRRFLGEKEGAIVELETGKKVGTHRGYWFHTIGQRKGLGLSGGPWFVVKKDIEENTIYVSRGYGVETQYGHEFRMHDFHFITDNPWKGQEKEIDITFKIRHTPEFTKGKLIQEGEKQFHILSSEKLQGIAPGQFGVIYDEEVKVCVGSGEIIC